MIQTTNPWGILTEYTGQSVGQMIIIIIFYWLLPEMCTVFNLEANWFQLYQGAHEVTEIIK